MLILVAVDGSESSRRAVEWCARIAPALGAEVIALHALEDPVYAVPRADALAIGPLPDEVRRGVRDLLEADWCAPFAAAGIAFRAELAEGPAAPAVIEAARRNDADLVVVGRRGRGGFAELELGSVGHQLAHHLGRPLTIVP